MAAPAASAHVVLIADATLTGSAAGSNADLSGLTGSLENGLPANLLGGLGSGLAYAGDNTFLAVPDRGPNATSYNSNVDLSGATDITNLSGAAAVAAAIGKTLFLDLVAALTANGIASDQIPAKIEGLAFGQDVLLDSVLEHTLFIANDNDFVADVAGSNRFFVFAFADSDLPGFAQQQFVPEPSSIAVLCAGLLGLALALRATGLRRAVAAKPVGGSAQVCRPTASAARCRV